MARCVEVCDMQNAETTLAIIRDRGKDYCHIAIHAGRPTRMRPMQEANPGH